MKPVSHLVAKALWFECPEPGSSSANFQPCTPFSCNATTKTGLITWAAAKTAGQPKPKPAQQLKNFKALDSRLMRRDGKSFQLKASAITRWLREMPLSDIEREALFCLENRIPMTKAQNSALKRARNRGDIPQPLTCPCGTRIRGDYHYGICVKCWLQADEGKNYNKNRNAAFRAKQKLLKMDPNCFDA